MSGVLRDIGDVTLACDDDKWTNFAYITIWVYLLVFTHFGETPKDAPMMLQCANGVPVVCQWWCNVPMMIQRNDVPTEILVMLLSHVIMIISLMHTMSIWWRDVLMCQWIANDDATYQWCSNRDIGDVTLACDDDNQFKAHNVKMIKGCIDDVAMCQGCASVLMVWKLSAPMIYRSANDGKKLRFPIMNQSAKSVPRMQQWWY